MNEIIQGNCLEILKGMQRESVDCIVTSPPYWALRDYKTESSIWDGYTDCEHDFSVMQFCSKCSAWKGSLGLEPTFDLYIKHLCDIFDEVRRVLKNTGTCWVNLGDSYAGSGNGTNDYRTEKSKSLSGKRFDYNMMFQGKQQRKFQSLPSKSLCMIPYRFAIEMQNRGWILRNVIIWHKPNCMPSSAKDRFTVDFEPIFFFSKSKQYYFELQYEDYSLNSDMDYRKTLRLGKYYRTKEPYKQNTPLAHDRNTKFNPLGRSKRTVWKVTTQPFSELHFAAFPEGLVETPIKAGCPEFVCSKCGKPREKICQSEGSPRNRETGKQYNIGNQSGISNISGEKLAKWKAEHPDKFIGYTSCSCNAEFISGTVMDIFAGSGTTCLVAKRLGRNYIGIELNSEYAKLANERASGFQRKDWKAKKHHKTLERIAWLRQLEQVIVGPAALLQEKFYGAV